MSAGDFVPTTTIELHERISAAHARFASVARELPPTLLASSWTSAEVVAHLVNVVNRYNEFDPQRLAADPRGVDDINQRELRALADRSVAELLDDLDREMEGFGDRWGPSTGMALDLPMPFHGGTTIDLQSALTNLIGEFLFHGLDLAKVGGRAWPLDRRDGELLCGFGTQILPAYVRRGNEHDLLIHFDLDGVAPWALEVRGPIGTSRAPVADDRADVTFQGAALPIARMFYGRLASANLADEGMRVGGAHPDRATTVSELFEVP